MTKCGDITHLDRAQIVFDEALKLMFREYGGTSAGLRPLRKARDKMKSKLQQAFITVSKRELERTRER